MFIDTHTHLYTEEFDNDRAEAVERAVDAGAKALLLPNIDEASINPMLRMCKDYAGLCFPMIGLHPTELPEHYEDTLARMEAMLQSNHPFIAIGEVGIDLYWDNSRREDQIAAFRRQIVWSIEHELPLVIHSRKAQREIIDTLQPFRHDLQGGIFHCFGGTAEEARELLEFEGFYLGIGGVVTFKKSTLPEVLKQCVPLSRIVVETDSPYLAPTPYRGKRNESCYVPLIIDRLAEVYDMPKEQIERQTMANTKEIFKKLQNNLAD